MAEIDFEKIRLEAVRAVTENLSQDDYSKVLHMTAEIASQVVKEMLIAYHKSCTLSQDG